LRAREERGGEGRFGFAALRRIVGKVEARPLQ
jgi:hypothetical protein